MGAGSSSTSRVKKFLEAESKIRNSESQATELLKQSISEIQHPDNRMEKRTPYGTVEVAQAMVRLGKQVDSLVACLNWTSFLGCIVCEKQNLPPFANNEFIELLSSMAKHVLGTPSAASWAAAASHLSEAEAGKDAMRRSYSFKDALGLVDAHCVGFLKDVTMVQLKKIADKE